MAAKRAATFWLIGLIFTLAGVLISIYEATMEEKYLVEQKKRIGSDDSQVDSIRDKFKALQQKKFDNLLNLLKTLGDMVTSSQAIGLPKKIIGIEFNDGHVGLGGLLSAVITCYQLYPTRVGGK